jgi:GntR family transcriptional regulator
MMPWSADLPIYRQIRDATVALILEGHLAEGTVIPSVRQVAAETQVNPLTVNKAYQALVDEGVIEKHRGLGFFVAAGAQARLQVAERARFLQEEWPLLRARLARLGLEPGHLWPHPESP